MDQPQNSSDRRWFRRTGPDSTQQPPVTFEELEARAREQVAAAEAAAQLRALAEKAAAEESARRIEAEESAAEARRIAADA
ncbi:MAG TPA: hypothetical protein VGE38_05340, partial [Nocardioides sp.]|uniref:hypothetical protein n=1 Tax=Nocardioides sp. TaxID=35761 RepID=UPI002EDAA25E